MELRAIQKRGTSVRKFVRARNNLCSSVMTESRLSGRVRLCMASITGGARRLTRRSRAAPTDPDTPSRSLRGSSGSCRSCGCTRRPSRWSPYISDIPVGKCAEMSPNVTSSHRRRKYVDKWFTGGNERIVTSYDRFTPRKTCGTVARYPIVRV